MGKVYLVGAGPGDPGLITVKGLEVLRMADAIVYDRLASPHLLDENESAEKIYCGKSAGHHSMDQEDINSLLYELSLKHDIVVRLKGGDPYVFGRGGEEAMYLMDKGAEFEVIPGITSGIGGFAYAGVPVTYRGIATSIHLITGHLKGAESIDFAMYAKLPGTLVFYMGVANLKAIASGLIEGGMKPSTPIMVLYNATHPDQESHMLTLDEVTRLEDFSIFKTPSLILVGEVVKFSESINFIDALPLRGKKVVITRSKSQSRRTFDLLTSLGAEVIIYPTIKTEAINYDVSELLEKVPTGIIAFSSANGVRYFMDKLFEFGDIRSIGAYKIASIGSETSKSLKTYGIVPDIEATVFTSEGFSESILLNSSKGDHLIIIRPEESRAVIANLCSEKLNCTEAIIYKTVKEVPTLKSIQELNEGFDYITFTSSSTVHSFISSLKKADIDVNMFRNIMNMVGTKSVSIGPITTHTLNAYGIIPALEPKEATVDSMINAILKGVNRC